MGLLFSAFPAGALVSSYEDALSDYSKLGQCIYTGEKRQLLTRIVKETEVALSTEEVQDDTEKKQRMQDIYLDGKRILKGIEDKIDEAIRDHMPAPGMTEKELISSVGQPATKSSYQEGRAEQWKYPQAYRAGRTLKTVYVYLKDGYVTNWKSN